MSERLTDTQITEVLRDYTANAFMYRLAREVRASRKLIADLRALRYDYITKALIAQTIDDADL